MSLEIPCQGLPVTVSFENRAKAVLQPGFRRLKSVRARSRKVTQVSVQAQAGSKREPWDIGRFAQTLITFNAPPSPAKVLAKVFGSEKVTTLDKGETFWSVSETNNIEWGSLDDVVMGGVSVSSFEISSHGGIFSGNISESNNGGFAGVRTKVFDLPFDLSKCTGIKIKFKGDGQRMKLVLRDDSDWNGIAWTAIFDTDANRQRETRIPFNTLKATKYAKILNTTSGFNSSNVCAVQLVLSKFEFEKALNPKFKAGRFEFTLID